jgi:hypothetical protein
MPDILYDGDYTVAQLVGPPEFEIPFKTDPKPYVYKLPYWQFLNNFEDLPFGTSGPLGGTYVGGTPGNFKSVGGGIVEFRREFALIPDTRSEYESFTYSYQLPVIGAQASIIELPLVVQSRLQFDYFQTDDPETEIDLPRAPRAVVILNVLYGFNDWGTLYFSPTGTEFLAEDATYKCWIGNIYERRQRFCRWINIADLVAIAGA